ncbi:MAG: hypothetical protein KAJ35_09870, partial [Thermoplasmata archaeon]|nr:hypothetical protein [Thermoplasmata archaeon]
DRGGRSQITLQIKVGNVGEPPEPPVFRHPQEGSTYNEGDTVLFSIGIEDPDLVFDIPVHLTVISNVSGILVTQEVLDDLTFTTSELGPGHHRITAIVKDGEFTERSEMTLVVIGEPDKTQVWNPPDELWLVLGLLAFSLALLVASYLIGFRRRKTRRRRL